MVTRLELSVRPELQDPVGEQAANKIRSFLGIPVQQVRTRDVYRIDAEMTAEEQARVLKEFVDPVSQVGAIGRLDGNGFDVALAVGYKPGVTDPVGKSARVAIEDTLGRRLADHEAVYCSRLYLIAGADEQQADAIGTQLLANPVIQTIEVASNKAFADATPDLTVPRIDGPSTPPPVARVDLSGDSAELERISRDGLLALTLQEMEAIRDHFLQAGQTAARKALGLGAEPTDVELECLAQTWSEHCSHKIFNATVTYREGDGPSEKIDSIFKQYIRRTTEQIDKRAKERDGRSWLVSVFHDNAGAVTFDDTIHLVYKVETHNSPSALDPYGGAITGIVGVNRDPFGTGLGCDLLTNVWGYCFASPFHADPLPTGLLHPRRIRDGVHHGVIDGGNQSGVPYGRGFEIFDKRYLGKPLVFCGTAGSMPVTIAGQPGHEKCANPGDRIVMTGGRIGADGIHGATFSSAALDESAPVQAVQIGDPITQKRMFDFLLQARDRGLYTAITDNGAGGLSSSVGEMAEGPGGARMDLSKAPLKYPGLSVWEILVSEAQERMTLSVAPEKLDAFMALAADLEVEATDLGEFTDDGIFHVVYGEETVAHLSMEFLHDGAPDLDLTAIWNPPTFEEPSQSLNQPLGESLLGMLGRLNLCSNEKKARHYDHEVKGLTVVKPFIGRGRDVPAEATVFLARHGSQAGFVLSEGINPFYSDIDTYAMAQSVVDEAVRKQLCAGARLDKIALLDNFCWPDPVQSDHTPDGHYKMAQLVRACRGLYHATQAYEAPLVSGKDSMKNDSTKGGVKISIPPTLLVSAMGQVRSVADALTLDLKGAGDVVFLLGTTRDELGGSEYYRYLGEKSGVRAAHAEPELYVGNAVPELRTNETLPLYQAVEAATKEGWIRSMATPARGGWGHALARSCMAGRLGMRLDLDRLDEVATLGLERWLFSESNGRFVVTVAAKDADAFEKSFAKLPCARVGEVTQADRLVLTLDGATELELSVDPMLHAFKETLSHA